MDLEQRLINIIERAERARTYGRVAFDLKNACLDDLTREANAALAFVRCEPGKVVRAIEGAPAATPNAPDDECYCDFASREFFGCFDRSHAAPCPQAKDPDQVRLWG